MGRRGNFADTIEFAAEHSERRLKAIISGHTSYVGIQDEDLHRLLFHVSPPLPNETSESLASELQNRLY